MQQGGRSAQGGAPPPSVYVLVSGSERGGKADPQSPAYSQQRREQEGAPSSGAAAAIGGAGSLPPPLPPAQPSQPWLLRALLLAAGLVAVAAGVALLVLWRTGVLWSGGGEDDWEPLPYSPRVRSSSATPAFSAELHAWLLPSEQAALGQQLDADVIIVGAGVAGLRAAQLLAPLMRVLVLEARVSGGEGAAAGLHLRARRLNDTGC